MTNFYKDKDNIYIKSDLFHDKDLSLTSLGLYVHLANNPGTSFSINELKSPKDNFEEIESALEQLIKKKLIEQKGWKYKVCK